ncbi:hypothetical protein SK128_010295 [Halocaridina rubra]|uniref:Uncharacterized protein n=1 Tax=Halocaridina rubra TaxID=373956 RepID=A0AAN9A5D4_HALRR
MRIFGALVCVLPALILASVPFHPNLKNHTKISLQNRIKRSACYAQAQTWNGYYNSCYDPCSYYNYYYNYNYCQSPCYYQYGTNPCGTWSTTAPTRPTYQPIMPTVTPVFTPATRPDYTPVWQTRTPAPPTRPTYIPVWQTRPTIYPTRPTYIPVWQTRPTIPPSVTPNWQTRSPHPTYFPVGQTRPPLPTYIPVGQTRPPIPTYIPVGQTRPTVTPAYPVWQTRPTYPQRETRPVPRPQKPVYSPIRQTRPYIQTKSPKEDRKRYITNKTDTKENSLKLEGCQEACVDEKGREYCCEKKDNMCPIIDKSHCKEIENGRNISKYLGANCTLDSQCPDEAKCCYNFCDDTYYCMDIKEWNNDTNTESGDPSYRYLRDDYDNTNDSWKDSPKHIFALDLAVAFALESNETASLLEDLKLVANKFKNYLSFSFFPIETTKEIGSNEVSNIDLGEVLQCAAINSHNQSRLLSLTICLLTSEFTLERVNEINALNAAKLCFHDAGYRWRPIATCIQENNGRQLLAKGTGNQRQFLDDLEQNYLSIIYEKIPVIALNGRVMNTHLATSMNWLSIEICKRLKHVPDHRSFCGIPFVYY